MGLSSAQARRVGSEPKYLFSGPLICGECGARFVIRGRSGVVHPVFPSRRGMVPAVRSLLDALSEGFAANPWLAGDGSNDKP